MAREKKKRTQISDFILNYISLQDFWTASYCPRWIIILLLMVLILDTVIETGAAKWQDFNWISFYTLWKQIHFNRCQWDKIPFRRKQILKHIGKQLLNHLLNELNTTFWQWQNFEIQQICTLHMTAVILQNWTKVHLISQIKISI